VQARLVRADGTLRTTVIRFAHLFTPGVGAGFVATIEDITERLAFEARLAHEANHDPLTGLPNRTLLAQHVAERFRPGVGGPACLFLDLDDFKVVNDSLGHTAGDELLVEVANRLRATVRPGDLVASPSPWNAPCAWAAWTCAPTPASASPCRPPSTPRPRS
jgi:predicted signal transduction protein with EAL and GGDEF domain